MYTHASYDSNCLKLVYNARTHARHHININNSDSYINNRLLNIYSSAFSSPGNVRVVVFSLNHRTSLSSDVRAAGHTERVANCMYKQVNDQHTHTHTRGDYVARLCGIQANSKIASHRLYHAPEIQR